MYVNDTKIYKEIKNMTDLFYLQHDLDKINNWPTRNGLYINHNICKSTIFLPSHVEKLSFPINNIMIENVTSFKDLDVTF